ncbi:MAG: class I SAM-dependent methyltransferase [Candidatus Cloacimonetes bacterium HGW-Cloacimonetes-1]|nr:MAG: class I SAM-dependent methyltransferase [Candidatus Cloacimonetes bacterium HGW-Cloacimonetes-1]
MKDVFKQLSELNGGKVLDAATGRGEFIQIIKQSFRSYTQIIGIDVSEKAVAHAEKLFPENNIEIFKMDLEDIQYEDGYFDTVTISNSLHHLGDVNKVLGELLRVLKPGGLLLVTEMYRDGKQSEAQSTHINMHHWISKIDRISNIPHNETFKKDEIIGFVNKLPLKNVSIEDFYYPTDNPKEVKSCESLIRNCTDTIKRLETMDNTSSLVTEGKQLINRINEIGCASASRLLILAHKQ